MRHNVSGRKFNRTKSHRDAMLANMAASLLEHKKLHTTEAKAKELRPFAEAIITKAKHALVREKQNLLPAGQTVDIHNRRLVYKIIRNKGVIQELFDAIAPVVEARNGGYCRITKTGTRRGDAARTAIIELVDWSAPVDGAVSNKRKKKSTSNKTSKKATTNKEKVEKPITKEAVTPVETAPEESVAPVVETAPVVEEAQSVETAPEESVAPVETTDTTEETKNNTENN
ncbi:MAG: 50S ribosomal protein L17 [Bacteroidetes bacterium]|nr:50S ribosomal protein L17 [Bacteroidota bacterium]